MYKKTNFALIGRYGSYLLCRDGSIIETDLHVPSTNYLAREIYHLSCTDGEFLFDQGMISEDEFKSIILYCYIEWLEDQGLESSSIFESNKFQKYADMRYAPKASSLFKSMTMKNLSSSLDSLIRELDSLPSFESINDRYYDYICNEFCKVSKVGQNVEFRITSNDKYDWNSTIIDDFILKYQSQLQDCRYSILKEGGGNRSKYYFINAYLSDIINNDKVVLSSEEIIRKELNGGFEYISKLDGRTLYTSRKSN